MILSIVLTPYIYKTCVVEDINTNGNNHIIDQTMNIGGTGIDTVRLMKILQSEPVVTGFLGGLNGRYIKSNLEKSKIKSHFMWVNADTKLNTTIIDSINGTKLTLYDDGVGANIQDKDLSRLLKDAEVMLKDSSVVVIDGSFSDNIPPAFYSEIVEVAQKNLKKCILSVKGEALRKAIDSKPYAIKVNRSDLVELEITNRDIKQQLTDLYTLLVDKNIHYIAFNLGLDGAYILSKNKICFVEPFKDVEPNNIELSESAFLAAFSVGIERKYEQEKISKMALGASFASMLYYDKDSLCTKAHVDMLCKKVKIREVMNRSKGWL